MSTIQIGNRPLRTFSFAVLIVVALLSQITSASILPAQSHTLQARAEAVGGACSNEGQWNCMTHTWQRCASNRWSVIMDCAAGTICTPAGLTNDFRVQHDGSANGGTATSGGNPGPGTSSGSMNRAMSFVALLAVVGVWGIS